MKLKDQRRISDSTRLEIRNDSYEILEKLSPRSASPSRFSIILEPPPETIEKSRAAYERLSAMRKSIEKFPYALDLDEGIALIALSDFRESLVLLETYLNRLQEGWEKSPAKRQEGQFLAWKASGDNEYYQTHYARAIGWYRDALKVKPDYFHVLNSIGLCNYWLRKYSDSQYYFQKALEIEAKKEKGNGNGYATSLHNLGMVFSSLGDQARALDSLNEALRLDQEMYGENHPDITRDLNNIGIALKLQGDKDGAMDKYVKALKIDEAIFGQDHPAIARDHSNIAHLQCSLDKHGIGLPHIIQAFKINYRCFGPDHPTTKNTRYGVELCGGDPVAIEHELDAENTSDQRK